VCGPPRRPLWKKMWNPRWWPRNGCDGRLIAKILIMTIQVNLVLFLWRRQHRFTCIVIIESFAISLPSQPFLGCHLGFHIFFHNDLLGGHTLFYSWAGFGLDLIVFCYNCQSSTFIIQNTVKCSGHILVYRNNFLRWSMKFQVIT